MMKGRIWSTGLFGLALLLWACNSGDNGGGTAPTSDEIVGKWYLRSIATKGTMTMAFPPLIDTTINKDTTETYSGTEYYMDFKQDKTYESVYPEGADDGPFDWGGGFQKRSAVQITESGIWSLEAGLLTTITDPDESGYRDTVAMNVVMSGSSLVGSLHIDTTSSEEGFTYSSDMTVTTSFSK